VKLLPSRRNGSLSTLLLTLTLAAACQAPSPQGQEGRARPSGKPPVVLISIDTLRSDHLPAYGYRRVNTPAIDELRRQAVLFTRAYTQVPLTLPSHSSMFSGQLPARHGVHDNLGYRYDGQRWPTLATLLARAGYATGGFVSAYVLREETGIGSGFATWDDEVQRQYGKEFGTSQRAGRDTVAAATRWLEGVADQPFFLFVHLFEPHLPHTPPEPFAARYKLPYDGEIAAADAAVGDLLAALRRLGVFDRAVIVLLADHGEGLGDHGEQEHGILLYRETLQVPLLLKLPGSRSPGRSERPVQLVDLFPTLLALAGVAPPAKERLAGLSLLEPSPPERALFAETFYPRHYGWSELASVIRGRYHYIHGPSPQLFDVVADPGERRDLLREQRRIYGELRDLARASLIEPPPQRVDSIEARQRLAALGYASASPAPAMLERPDPRDRIAAVATLQETAALIGEHRTHEAAVRLRRLLTENPTMVLAWQQLGRALEEEGELESSLQAYQRALSFSPHTPDPLSLAGAGKLLLLLGRSEEARALAETALESSPGLGHELLASLALGRGDLAAAEREAQAMLQTEADPVVALLMLARVQTQQGRFADAWQTAERANQEARRQGAPRKVPGLHLLRGDVLANLGRLREAEQELRAEITDFPASLHAYTNLAALYVAAGEGAAGRSVLLRMINNNGGSPAAYAEAVRMLRVLGDTGGADALLRRGLALHPEDRRLHALAG
jgi:arylsulfatase A-like enzyme/Flp pilus assembly protein TadD